ncbi:MAG: serine/threonine-protein kinase, partial [Verrucomicrobiales bacterium]
MSETDHDDAKENPSDAGGAESLGDAFDGLLDIFEARATEGEVTRQVAGRNGSARSMPQHGERQFIPGTIIAQRYRIVSLIGRGGMGEVYQAEDLTIGETVALKFLPRELVREPVRLEALYNEVRHGRRVTHPNVCRVHDIAEIDGRHFLSMEFIDGENLGQLLRRIGKLPRDKVIQLARQLCAGLAAAHEQGVLHLDLKPANLMIDGRGNLHITDFGLAKLSDEDSDSTDPIIGTPPYMAPEQLRIGETSVQSDIYALGLIITEMLTGTPVQRGDGGIDEILRRHDATPPDELASSALQMDEPEITDVILASLEKDPANRPGSVAEVAARLPGGTDALAEALAAGETPDPELVAAAGERGTLRSGIGLALLLGCLVLITGIAILKDPSRPGGVVKTAEVLESEAMGLLREQGVPPSAYSKYGLSRDRVTGSVYFWYRESPRALFPEKGLQ